MCVELSDIPSGKVNSLGRSFVTVVWSNSMGEVYLVEVKEGNRGIKTFQVREKGCGERT